MECMLAASPRKYGLVLGAEMLSRFINWEDRSTCVLFGDAAGAAVVEWSEDYESIHGLRHGGGVVAVRQLNQVETKGPELCRQVSQAHDFMAGMKTLVGGEIVGYTDMAFLRTS